MSRQRQKAPMRLVAASWILIWFGTILAVNPREAISHVGAGLWASGLLIQYVIGVRWLIGRPASDPPSEAPRPSRMTIRV